ncbi:MAG: thermonuclease family protein [Hyphomicrobiaceae bacterium]|nr:thermonuclease family protein [Hyphomicrobiaceae bacterium]
MVESYSFRGPWLVAFALVPTALVAASAHFVGTPAVARAAIEAPAIRGPARVVDGDTLDVAGQRVRLEGIDAPELGQTCPGRYLGGALGPWSCGQAAASHLRQLTGLSTVACEVAGTDKYGRVLGRCRVEGLDINAEMVRSGLAWAFVRYSDRYVRDEAEARARRVGMWRSEEAPQPAWDFRQAKWTGAAEVAPNGCAIKGNVSGSGRIYHPPWSPWYDRVTVDEARGERWFCDEAEAQAAGWRAAGLR